MTKFQQKSFSVSMSSKQTQENWPFKEGNPMRALTYYQRNRAKVLRKTRQTRLTTKGGQVMTGLKKRLYTHYCELCGKRDKVEGKDVRLHYHHWNPKVPSLGLWLCFACHIFAELMDNPKWPDMARAYEVLKNETTKEYDAANS